MAKTGAGFEYMLTEKFNQSSEIIKYLRSKAGHKLSADRIATYLRLKFPEHYKAKLYRSEKLEGDSQLHKQIISEVNSYLSRVNTPEIRSTNEKPRKFYWEDGLLNTRISFIEKDTSKKSSEHDLYPLLSGYLYYELGLHPKRIDEKRSSNRQGAGANRWLHPDLVCMEQLGKDWHDEVKNCVKEYTRQHTKLWSFEVKLQLNRSNVRESFFQTVSNSSWANFGYLVAASIKDDTQKELRMLSAAHGIGLIKLDTTSPHKSQIVIPAKEREEIDWDMVDRLVKENSDFCDYIQNIRHFYQTINIRPQDWNIPKKSDWKEWTKG